MITLFLVRLTLNRRLGLCLIFAIGLYRYLLVYHNAWIMVEDQYVLDTGMGRLVMAHVSLDVFIL